MPPNCRSTLTSMSVRMPRIVSSAHLTAFTQAPFPSAFAAAQTEAPAGAARARRPNRRRHLSRNRRRSVGGEKHSRTGLEDARRAQSDHPPRKIGVGTDARRLSRIAAPGASQTVANAPVPTGVSLIPPHHRHPPSPPHSANVISWRAIEVDGAPRDHGGPRMPDPLAGLPPRFLRTPEAARFFGAAWPDAGKAPRLRHGAKIPKDRRARRLCARRPPSLG